MSQNSDAVALDPQIAVPPKQGSPKRVVVDRKKSKPERRRFVIYRRQPTETRDDQPKYQASPEVREVVTEHLAPTEADIPRALPSLAWISLVGLATWAHPVALVAFVSLTAFVAAVQRSRTSASGNRRHAAIAVPTLLLPMLAFNVGAFLVGFSLLVLATVFNPRTKFVSAIKSPRWRAAALYSLCASSLAFLSLGFGRSYAVTVLVLGFAYDVGHRVFNAPHARRWEAPFAGWLTVAVAGIAVADVVGTSQTFGVLAFVVLVCAGAVFSARLWRRLGIPGVRAPLAARRLDSLVIAAPMCLIVALIRR